MRRRSFSSFLYHASFWTLIVCLAALLVGSAWGLGEQAWRTDHQRRWNMFALIAAYVALDKAIVSLIHVLSRVASIRWILTTMPKPYMPTKQVDLPKKVANHIQTEYSRAAVIAHISQATSASQEGWGSPGTKWDGVHFRTHILGTLEPMRETLEPDPNAPPTALHALVSATEKFGPPPGEGRMDALRVLVASYVSIVRRAMFARQEPTEGEADSCDKILNTVRLIVDRKRGRQEGRQEEDLANRRGAVWA